MCHLVEFLGVALLCLMLPLGLLQMKATRAFTRHLETHHHEAWKKLGGSEVNDEESWAGLRLRRYLLDGSYEQLAEPQALALGQNAERWHRVVRYGLAIWVALLLAGGYVKATMPGSSCWLI